MDRLKRDPQGRPIYIELPLRAQRMEAASNDFWERLKRLTIQDLQSLQPSGPFIGLIDALIEVRRLMGDDRDVGAEIADIERRSRSSHTRFLG